MIPDEVETDDIGSEDFYENDEKKDDSYGQEGNRDKRCSSGHGIIDCRASGILIGGEDGPFVIIDEAFFIKILGHDGSHIRGGKAGNEGKTADSGDAHKETENGLEKFSCRKKGAVMLAYFQKSHGNHSHRNHGEGKGKSIPTARSAGSLEGDFGSFCMTELAQKAHEVQCFERRIGMGEDAGEADDEK